jgi:prevent-host-death family protein
VTRHVPIAEFKDHLSELVAAAAKGEEIVVTRHGKAQVKLVPIDDSARKRRAEEATRRIREHVALMRANGWTATAAERRAWIDEGRP